MVLSWSSSIGFESFLPSVLLLTGIIHVIFMDVLVVVAIVKFVFHLLDLSLGTVLICQEELKLEDKEKRAFPKNYCTRLDSCDCAFLPPPPPVGNPLPGRRSAASGPSSRLFNLVQVILLACSIPIGISLMELSASAIVAVYVSRAAATLSATSFLMVA
nr:hypothetical protein [Tanacetum cinerariifolium]